MAIWPETVRPLCSGRVEDVHASPSDLAPNQSALFAQALRVVRTGLTASSALVTSAVLESTRGGAAPVGPFPGPSRLAAERAGPLMSGRRVWTARYLSRADDDDTGPSVSSSSGFTPQ